MVEHDRQRLIDVLLRHLSEAARADQIEAEAHDRLVLLEGRLGVDEVLAGHFDPVAHNIFGGLAGLGVIGGHQRRVRRQHAALGVRDRCVHVEQVEGQSRRLAEQAFDAVRIALARHLHQDAVRALALDGRLARANLIDAPADDLERLVDGLADPLLPGSVGHLHRDPAVVGDVDIDLPLRQVRIENRQGRQHAIAVGRLTQVEHDVVALDAEIAVADRIAVATQRRPHLVDHALHAITDHSGTVHLQQQMRSALQVKAEIDLLPGQKARPGIDRLARE